MLVKSLKEDWRLYPMSWTRNISTMPKKLEKPPFIISTIINNSLLRLPSIVWCCNQSLSKTHLVGYFGPLRHFIMFKSVQVVSKPPILVKWSADIGISKETTKKWISPSLSKFWEHHFSYIQEIQVHFRSWNSILQTLTRKYRIHFTNHRHPLSACASLGQGAYIQNQHWN